MDHLAHRDTLTTDPPPQSSDPGLVGLLSSVARSVAWRIFLFGIISIPLLALLIFCVASFRVAPTRGVGIAVAIGLAAMAAATVCTAWCAITNAILRAAADAVEKSRLSHAMVECVFEAACRAVPSLADHEVSGQIDRADWTALRDALQRLRKTTCGDARGLRGRAAAWVFDAVARRIERSLALVLERRQSAGEPIRFRSIPSLAARLVNDSTAGALRSSAWRIGAVWLVAVSVILSGLAAVK